MKTRILTAIILSGFMVLYIYTGSYSSSKKFDDNSKEMYSANATVTIDGSMEYQTIEGLGGGMEAHGFSTRLWNLLFNDIGVSAILLFPFPDHAALDQKEIFPMLREAKAHGVKHFYACFASPPEQWKDGDSLLPEYYDDWAKEMLKYMNYMKKHTGVKITHIAPFNEPTIGSKGPWPSCKMSVKEYSDFLKVAGPLIKKEDSQVAIHAPVNYSVDKSISYAKYILSEPEAGKYVDVLSTHAYSWKKGETGKQKWQELANIGKQYGKKTYSSENWHCCGNPEPHPAGIYISKWIHEAFAEGNAVVFHWWFMLDKGMFNKDYSRGLITSGEWLPGVLSSTGITKYGYAFKQFAHWIRPGAIRVEAASNDLNVLVSSYKHLTDRTFTSVAINDSTMDKSITFNIDNIGQLSELQVYRTSATENTINLGQVSVVENSFTYTLPKESITTFTGNFLKTKKSVES